MQNNKINNVLALLKEKIEEAMMNEDSVIVSVSNSVMSCMNSIFVESYMLDDENFHLSAGDYEFDIKINDLKEIKYDENIECNTFTFIDNNNTEIHISFL